jgi:hypothetical protein
MSRLEALKSAQMLSDVAKLLLFKPSALSYLIIKQPSASKYTTFEIPKRTLREKSQVSMFFDSGRLRRN